MKTLILAGLIGLAASVTGVHAGEFDGTWTGFWGGKTPGVVRVKDNVVTQYIFDGRIQRVGKSSVAGKTISFGSGYNVSLTMTGAKSATANYKGSGRATASMTRK